MSETDSSVVIVDYGMGNIRSIYNALEVVGGNPRIVDDPDDIGDADGIIVPGVGAFADGMAALHERGFVEALERHVQTDGIPYLGLCLGMQFLATESYEHGEHDGLGWIPGVVRRIEPEDETFTIPHMGWNSVDTESESPLYSDFPSDPTFYFVHSYQFDPETASVTTGTSWHGAEITASVRKDNIFGVQFHPEKSQGTGLRLLENFTDYVERRQN
jgi:glutamine amidotransferase